VNRKGITKVAQNKSSKKDQSTGPASSPSKSVSVTPSTAGQAKMRRVAAQKTAEARNKELRAQGKPTPWQAAKAKRAVEREKLGQAFRNAEKKRIAKSKEDASKARKTAAENGTAVEKESASVSA
jgi:hypothetical protein